MTRLRSARRTGSDAAGWSAEVVRAPLEEAGLVDVWRAAAVRSGNAFATPDWYFAFLGHAPGTQPFVIVVREHGELRGVMPLVDDGKVLRFAGAQFGDCYRPLAVEGHELAVVEHTAALLARSSHGWSRVVFDRMEGEFAGAMIEALGRSGLPRVTAGRDWLPMIDLAGRSFDDYLHGRSGNFRSEIGRKQRALSRDCRHAFVEIRGGPELGIALERHFELHDLRWRADRKPAPTGSDRARTFFALFAAAAADHGWLRLWRLEVDGRAVASWCGWKLGPRYSYYQAGLDTRWSRYSPGTLLLAHTIRAAIEEGCTEYDFLLGSEAYKRRFTDGGRGTATIAAASRLSPLLVATAGKWRCRVGARHLPPPVRRVLRQVLRAQ